MEKAIRVHHLVMPCASIYSIIRNFVKWYCAAYIPYTKECTQHRLPQSHSVYRWWTRAENVASIFQEIFISTVSYEFIYVWKKKKKERRFQQLHTSAYVHVRMSLSRLTSSTMASTLLHLLSCRKPFVLVSRVFGERKILHSMLIYFRH